MITQPCMGIDSRCANILSLGFVVGLSACGASQDDGTGADSTSETTKASGPDTGSSSTGTANPSSSSSTSGDNQCEEPPAVPDGASDECASMLLGCYTTDCSSFEYDPNDCWNTILEWDACAGVAGTGTSSSGTDTGTSTDGSTTSDLCEDPPPVPEDASDECAGMLVTCYTTDCDSFEYDPNDCWNTVLEFPACDGVAETTG